ncbi:hypothetical protein EAF00_008707 [Botryotinia globosa]|nr:hypothetical protein EAF00_008707 [Botryotinia globosa]
MDAKQQPGWYADLAEYESMLTLSQELDSQKLLNAPAISSDLDACNQHNAVASFPEWTSKCETCQNIWHCFSEPALAKPVNLGSFTEALTTPCRTHKPLVQAFIDHVRSCEDPWSLSRQKQGGLGIFPKGLESSVAITESISKWVWHEETIPDAEVDKYIDLRQNVITAGFPDLCSLSDILSNFNETELRYDEDALPAISGLLSVLSRTFTGGFLYGIPKMFFERGLGWKLFGKGRPSQAGLPSWSWVGWHGLINIFTYGEAARINDRQKMIEETIPITKWYTSNSSSDLPENRRRIRSTWFENRDNYKDFAKPLPTGWSCHEASDTGSFQGEPHLYPNGCGKYVFKHVNMPDSDMGSWYYPFPVPDTHNSTPPVMPEQTSYLFCKTWRAHLWGRQAIEGNIARIFNSSGEGIGSLQLHNEADLSLSPSIDSEEIHGLPVDLIALYKSRTYSKTWNAGQRKHDHPLRREDNYKVLWVEWKEGIAYRLASGQVKAEDWEKLDPEKIDLILG